MNALQHFPIQVIICVLLSGAFLISLMLLGSGIQQLLRERHQSQEGARVFMAWFLLLQSIFAALFALLVLLLSVRSLATTLELWQSGSPAARALLIHRAHQLSPAMLETVILYLLLIVLIIIDNLLTVGGHLLFKRFYTKPTH